MIPNKIEISYARGSICWSEYCYGLDLLAVTVTTTQCSWSNNPINLAGVLGV